MGGGLPSPTAPNEAPLPPALGPFAASPVALADLAATHTLELLFVAASGQTATPVDAHTEV